VHSFTPESSVGTLARSIHPRCYARGTTLGAHRASEAVSLWSGARPPPMVRVGREAPTCGPRSVRRGRAGPLTRPTPRRCDDAWGFLLRICP